jgi:hypothetical protein
MIENPSLFMGGIFYFYNVKKLKYFLVFIISFYLLILFIMSSWQKQFIFFPESLPGEYQFSFANEHEELWFDVDNEVSLNALLFEAEAAKGTIIYFHGNAGSLRMWGNVADNFLKHNFNVLVYDYRGYGKSGGEIDEEKFYSDAVFIFDKLKVGGNEKIILYGRSLGSGIAANLASLREPDLLILEAPYYSMKDVASRLYPFLPVGLLLKYNFPTYKFIENVKCPIVIFHGTDDEVIYSGSSEKLKKHLKPGDEVYFIDGAHHNDLEFFKEYKIKLKKVLEEL